MANLLDDLKGILSPEDFAKIEGNPALKARTVKAAELLDWYGGDPDPDPALPVKKDPDPAPVKRDPPQFDLSGIERMFDARLGKINETIETKIADVVKTRGDELVNNAVKIALQRSDELNRIYSRHLKETGTEFDTVKFNEYLEKPEIKAKGFRSLTDAYEAYAAPVVQEREVDRRVQAKLAEKSGQNVPGTTPAPSTNPAILAFKKRNVATDGQGMTGAQRAAALLDRRAAEQSA
jgi:hypothetical protein